MEEANMKKLFLAALAAFMILALAGCGDDGYYNNYPPHHHRYL